MRISIDKAHYSVYNIVIKAHNDVHLLIETHQDAYKLYHITHNLSMIFGDKNGKIKNTDDTSFGP